MSAKRIFVARSIYDEFASRLATRADALSVGDPFSTETDVGPLVSAKGTRGGARVRGRKRRRSWPAVRAVCAVRGVRARPLFRPTVLAGSVDPLVLPGGVLRAVVCVAPFDDETTRFAKANASSCRLGPRSGRATWRRTASRVS